MRGGPAAVAVVATALLLAGCGSRDVDGRLQPDPVAATSSSPAPTAPATSTAPEVEVAPQEQALADVIGMQTSDFADGYALADPSLSTALTVATLDHCGSAFPSEADRTARRARILLAPDGGRMGVLSEAVTYSSEAAATQALDELTAAVAACADGTPVRLAGVEAVLRQDLPGTVPADGLVPEADRAVVGVRYESGDGTVVLRTISLWQRQGRGLVELLLTHTDQPFTDADLGRLGGLGAKIAGHLEDQAAALS